MRYFVYKLYLLCTLFTICACGEGLAPNNSHIPENKTYLTGTIHYKGGKESWKNVQDSLAFIRVVGFKTYPDSAGIIRDILAGNVYITPKVITESLPFNVDSSTYSLEFTDVPVNILYLAAVQQYGADLTKQQRVIGIYTLTGDNTKPSSILVEKGKQNKADIEVDFLQLPPQPF